MSFSLVSDKNPLSGDALTLWNQNLNVLEESEEVISFGSPSIEQMQSPKDPALNSVIQLMALNISDDVKALELLNHAIFFRKSGDLDFAEIICNYALNLSNVPGETKSNILLQKMHIFCKRNEIGKAIETGREALKIPHKNEYLIGMLRIQLAYVYSSKKMFTQANKELSLAKACLKEDNMEYIKAYNEITRNEELLH